MYSPAATTDFKQLALLTFAYDIPYFDACGIFPLLLHGFSPD
jgi:hypothetical protein